MDKLGIASSLHGRRPARAGIAACWRGLMKRLFEPYRPELHYMRGPGPKWRAKRATGHP